MAEDEEIKKLENKIKEGFDKVHKEFSEVVKHIQGIVFHLRRMAKHERELSGIVEEFLVKKGFNVYDVYTYYDKNTGYHRLKITMDVEDFDAERVFEQAMGMYRELAKIIGEKLIYVNIEDLKFVDAEKVLS